MRSVVIVGPGRYLAKEIAKVATTRLPRECSTFEADVARNTSQYRRSPDSCSCWNGSIAFGLFRDSRHRSLSIDRLMVADRVSALGEALAYLHRPYAAPVAKIYEEFRQTNKERKFVIPNIAFILFFYL